MPSSRSMSRRFPRERRKLSSNTSCSRVSRPNRPTVNSPSNVVPQERQWRRVTFSSFEQTGQVAITSCGMRFLSCVHRLSHSHFHFVKSLFLFWYERLLVGSPARYKEVGLEGSRRPQPRSP